MSSLNKVMLIGNLGRDPEIRFTQSGQQVATFSLATGESWTDQNGNKQERTEWHRIVVWGKQADLCQRFLNKGRQVYLEGRLQTREWTDQSGQKRNTTEVVVTNIVLLSSGRGAQGDYATPPPYGAAAQPPADAPTYGAPTQSYSAPAPSYGKANDGDASYAEPAFGDAGITDSDIPF